MAAVFALVMLPLIAAIGFFVGVVRSDLSFGSALAGTVFVSLAFFVFVGSLRIARETEGPEQHAP